MDVSYGADMVRVASLIGDPARSLMLCALMSGQALTAGELAMEGGVTKQTASSHFAKMLEGGLLAVEQQGRHRYYRLANAEVANLLETMITVFDGQSSRKTKPGPRNENMRKARICYDHLAGEMAVTLMDSLLARSYLTLEAQPTGTTPLSLSLEGQKFFTDFGIDVQKLETAKRPVCRTCLDWSVRRPHLAGGLGAALLKRFFELGWAKRDGKTRHLTFTTKGEQAFFKTFSS